MQYNVFGPTFQAVAQSAAELGLNIDHISAGFDAAVLRVHKDSVALFLDELRARLQEQVTAARAATQGAAVPAPGAGGGSSDHQHQLQQAQGAVLPGVVVRVEA